MKTIVVEYRYLFGLKSRKLLRRVPSAWHEINADQLRAIANNYSAKESRKTVQMLSALSKLPSKVFMRLSPYEQFKIAGQFSFLEQFEPLNYFIIEKAGIFRSPKKKLKGMSFGQFIFADTYYSDWLKSNAPEDLNRFFATLYLPKNRKFNTDNVEAFAIVASKIGTVTKYAVSINYRLLKEFLSEAYPLVFEKTQNDKGSRSGWIKVVEAVVGDNLINQDKYLELPLHTILRYITNKIKHYKKSG